MMLSRTRKEERIVKKMDHEKTVLARNPAGSVVFCRECEVVELNLGPASLRIMAEDMAKLCELVHEANTALYKRVVLKTAEDGDKLNFWKDLH